MKQGFAPDFVSMVEAANEPTKNNLARMLEKVTARKESRRMANARPLDVAGESYLNRIQIVQDARARAADEIDDVADSLKGQSVDVSLPVSNFAKGLERMGIGLEYDPAANRVVGNYDGSDIEGLDGLVNLVNRTLKRMSDTKGPDAYDAHRLKRYIDENVSYDKSQGGLGGRIDTIIKRLRSQIDGTLDVQFPEYNRVNSTYSETTQAINDLQGIIGQKYDINDPTTIGSQLRTLLTNYKVRPLLEKNVEEMQNLARKYSRGQEGIIPYEGVLGGRKMPTSADIEDDLMTLLMFNDELEGVFGSSARGSMQGVMDKAADRAAVGVLSGQSGVLPLMEAGAKWGMDKIRRIDEDRALEAMQRLLDRR